MREGVQGEDGVSDTIGGYLRADEKLLWKGRPQQGLRFYGQDVFVIPFSLVWTGIVLSFFLPGGIPLSEGGVLFMIVPTMFAVFAAYFTVGRLIHDAWVRSNIEYAVADRRVLILKTGLGADLTTLDIGRIDQIRFKPRGDRGDLVFGPEPALFGLFGARSMRGSFAMWVPALSETPQFLGVDNARRVFDQIEGLRARSGA